MKELGNLLKNIFENKWCKLLLLALLATMPILLYQDIPISHDILFHLSRIKGISYEISNNTYFSYIYHNFLNNLGYASPLFYADFFLYPFAFLYKIFNLSLTYKIMMFSINLVTIYVIDFVLNKMFKNVRIINIGRILYLFSSYRMVDLYARGCIGEGLTFIFLPLVILGLEEIIYGNKKRYYFLVIGMTGIIYSHVISTLIVGIFIFCYLILNLKYLIKDKRYIYLFLSILITFLLTCNFLLPLLEQLIERNFYIHSLNDSYKFNNISVPIYKLFLEIPLPTKEWLPFGIGIIYLYVIYLGYKYRIRLKYNDYLFLILGLFFLLCSTDLVPNVIYDKFLYLIQFQWRFYIIATVSLFFFLCKIMKVLSEKEISLIKKIVFVSVVIVLTVNFSNNMIYKHTDEVYGEYLGFYEYLPAGIDVNDVIDNKIVDSCNNDIDYNYYFDKNKIIVNYDNNNYDNTVLTLPLLYYKGYTTSKDYNVINNNGLVSLDLDKVSDEFIVYYQGTKVALISRIITFITIIIIICYYVREKK